MMSGSDNESGSSGDAAGSRARGKQPMSSREQERAKKRKLDVQDKAQKEWEAKIEEWNFNCERQVMMTQMHLFMFVELIRKQKLDKFFEPVIGYKPKLVRAFYKNMKAKLSTSTITSQVGGKTVVITPDLIADYLNYPRPGEPTYVYRTLEGEEFAEYLPRVLDLIADGVPETFQGGHFVPGYLNNTFRALNKIFHHNLSPFIQEKRLAKKDADLLYVFGRPQEVRCDWAKFIWNEIEMFRRSGLAKKNIPFPAMVTEFCRVAGVSAANEKLVPPMGPFNLASYTKSQSLAKPQRIDVVPIPRPLAPTGTARVEEWLEILTKSMEAAQVRDEQRALAIQSLDRKVSWLISEHTATTGRVYTEQTGERGQGSGQTQEPVVDPVAETVVGQAERESRE